MLKKQKRIIVLVCTVLLILSGAGMFSRGQAEQAVIIEPHPQTLQEVLRLAYVSNPTLRAARTELKATHELLPQALSGWRPTVSADASLTASKLDGSNFGSGDGSTAKDVALTVSQPLYRGGQTFSETAAARHTIMAQKALLRAKEQTVLLEAATAYMDVLRDKALFDLSWNNREVIARQLEATEDRFEVGELTRTDVSQAQARLAKADADAITARGQLRSSEAAFEEVVGRPAERLVAPTIELDLPSTLLEVTNLAELESPNVLAAIYAHKASEEDVDGVYSELLPEIGLFGSWNKTRDPSPGLIDKQTTKAVGLSATIPLYKAGAVRSRVRQAKQLANQRYIEIIEARRRARREAISIWEGLDAARAEIRARESQAKASQVAQEGVKAEADVGLRTVLDALDADQEFLDAQVALVTAKRNEVVATFSLSATLGLLEPERLGFAGDTINLDKHLDDVRWKFFDMGVDRVVGVD